LREDGTHQDLVAIGVKACGHGAQLPGFFRGGGAAQVAPVAHHMDLGLFFVAFDQADGTGVGPAFHSQLQQAGEEALFVGFGGFVATTDACALADGCAEAGFAGGEFFEADGAVAKAVLVGDVAQGIEGSMAAGKQAVQLRRGGKVHVFGIHHLGLIARELQAAQLAVAAQFLVEKRVLLLDLLGFEQQGANLAGGAGEGDALGLSQQPCLVGVAQVREQAGTDVHALADVERQVSTLAMEDVDARARGRVLDGGAQVLRVLVDPALFKVFAAAAG